MTPAQRDAWLSGLSVAIALVIVSYWILTGVVHP